MDYFRYTYYHTGYIDSLFQISQISQLWYIPKINHLRFLITIISLDISNHFSADFRYKKHRYNQLFYWFVIWPIMNTVWCGVFDRESHLTLEDSLQKNVIFFLYFNWWHCIHDIIKHVGVLYILRLSFLFSLKSTPLGTC